MMMEKLVEMVDSVPWLRAERAMKQPNNDQPGGGGGIIYINWHSLLFSSSFLEYIYPTNLFKKW